MTVQPTFDYFLGEEIKNDSGVVTTYDKNSTQQKFKVLAVGPGRFEYGVFIEPTVKVGDIVFVQLHADADTPQELKDKGQALVMSSRIMGICNE